MTEYSNLENRLTNNNYKSSGEKKIAEFLDHYKIPYQYEKELLIKDKDKSRIWYPDFYLYKYGNIIIEYFGIENDPFYDRNYSYKKRIYSENHIDLIEIFPKDIRERNLENKILNGVNNILSIRMDQFKKIYNSQSNKNNLIFIKLPHYSKSQLY